ncbi:ATP-binding protein [Microbispora bryophytorum]|uniref:ATP-binding protein n=1 Tax=Microbispora bryophytorum subsp. camponoti TaxID=1677852 RepID=A0ABR8L0D7_9ACTN|nr:ATP-binding protein [Microbispora camponoti]MBD3144438.1 ATP-binding protein [Microbispora camponoti]
MTADLAGPGAATAPPWLTSMFERDDVAGASLPPPATCTFQGRAASAAAARDFTARTLCGWGVPGLVPDVQIVVSELVTNALRHVPGDSADAPPIRLRLVKHRFHIGCGVSDASERVPAVSPWNDLSESGRGLHLVEALTAAWGWILTRGGGGKVVWALFDTSRAS